MSGRRSAAVERALKLCKPGSDVYRIATKAGVAHTSLIRALQAEKRWPLKKT